MAAFTLGAIVARLGGELVGDTHAAVQRVQPLGRAGPQDIAFLTRSKLRGQLADTRAGAVILPDDLKGVLPPCGNAIYTRDPYLYYARLSQWLWQSQQPPFQPGRHALAQIDPQARVSDRARIDAFAVIEAGAEIADGVHVGSGCHVGRDAQVGEGTVMHPRSVVLWGCRLGMRCVLKSGAVIGSDGFGFARDAQGAGVKIAQVGSVVIGDDVEIGANSTIDRGALDDTVIGEGVKIDNLVQIAHNVRIGRCCVIVAQVGISGSTTLEDFVVLAGQAGISGHVTLGKGARIGPQAGVMSDVKPGIDMLGSPAQPAKDFMREVAAVRRFARRGGLRHSPAQPEPERDAES